jgi:hypothetical protein
VRPMTLAHRALVGAVVILLMTGAGTALAGEAHRQWALRVASEIW